MDYLREFNETWVKFMDDPIVENTLHEVIAGEEEEDRLYGDILDEEKATSDSAFSRGVITRELHAELMQGYQNDFSTIKVKQQDRDMLLRFMRFNKGMREFWADFEHDSAMWSRWKYTPAQPVNIKQSSTLVKRRLARVFK